MKSSTIRRSNLSKEKMAVLEALSKYRNEPFDNSVGVYVRPVKERENKEKELDMLWQNFNINKKSEKSPNVYLVSGFIAGAIVMLALTILVSFSARGIESVKDNFEAPSINTKHEKLSLKFIPSSEKTETSAVNEIYTVQDGDTMEAILIRFYGSYSKEKESLVLKTNNMSNPNKLSIGQQLTIPME